MALAFRDHVVFLDIGMPDMSGYEVARHLLAAPATAISQTDCTDRLRCKAGHPEIHNGGLSCPPHQASRSGCGGGLVDKAVTGEASRLKAGYFNPAAARRAAALSVR